LPDEAASVSRLRMTYIHIPFDFQNPTDDDFHQCCFFYPYRRDVLVGEAKARADMEQIWPGGSLDDVYPSLR